MVFVILEKKSMEDSNYTEYEDYYIRGIYQDKALAENELFKLRCDERRLNIDRYTYITVFTLLELDMDQSLDEQIKF